MEIKNAYCHDYFLWAHRAVIKEKNEEWNDAIQCWNNAGSLALNNINQEWAFNRADYCIHQSILTRTINN